MPAEWGTSRRSRDELERRLANSRTASGADWAPARAARSRPGQRETEPPSESPKKAGVSSQTSRGIAGRERASATTLEEPDTCRMSVEYSAMKDRWRVCLGDFSTSLVIAPHRGLLSVKIAKQRPSRLSLKYLMVRYRARSSRSKALYFRSAVDSFFEKKASGWLSDPVVQTLAQQNRSHGCVRHVCGEGDRGSRVRVDQHGGGGELGLGVVEGLDMGRLPVQNRGLLGSRSAEGVEGRNHTWDKIQADRSDGRHGRSESGGGISLGGGCRKRSPEDRTDGVVEAA